MHPYTIPWENTGMPVWIFCKNVIIPRANVKSTRTISSAQQMLSLSSISLGAFNGGISKTGRKSSEDGRAG
jgi:hypothetical protein